MKINHKNALLILALTFTAVQCKKEKTSDPVEEEPTPTTPVTVNNVTDLFATNGAQVSNNVVTSTASQTISVSGVQVEFPANVFKTATGGTVTGNVTVSVKKIITKADVILSGAPANSSSNSRLVATKGCIKVNASQNGQVLRITPGQPVFVNVPEPTMNPASNMRKYYASKVSTSDSTLCWKTDPDTLNIPVIFDTLANKYFYHARIDSVNWLNVGKIWDTTSAKTAVTVTVASTYNKTNTAVYISLNGSRVIVGSLYEISPNTFRISGIPVGVTVNIVAIGAISGQYHSATQQTMVSPGAVIGLNIQPTSFSTIQTQLNALP
jgi:hypothetical protein